MKQGSYFNGFARFVGIPVAAVTGTNLTEVAVFCAPFRCEIVKVGIVPHSAITGAATDNFVLGFKNKGSDGTGTTVIDSETFSSGVDVAAFDFKDYKGHAQTILKEGDTITFYKAVNNNGANMPALLAVIYYTKK